MDSTSNSQPLSQREIFYFRQRLKNRVFQTVVAYFADRAQRIGLTKRDIATRLAKDPAQITRWLSGPGNLTLDTVSDLLLAMNAEMEPSISAFDSHETSNDTARAADRGKVLFLAGVNSGTTATKFSYGQ